MQQNVDNGDNINVTIRRKNTLNRCQDFVRWEGEGGTKLDPNGNNFPHENGTELQVLLTQTG